MRKINTADVFKMARIIKAAKVKDAIAEIFEENRKETIVIMEDDSPEEKDAKLKEIENKKEAAGFHAIMTIFEACSTEELEKKIYEFIGGIAEKNPDDIGEQSLETTIGEIREIVRDNNIADFFKQADQLTK